ncbi:MAG: hypothetical protein GY767_03585 [Shimia sp.]|nr:hypothetical protein [Shimia sp.]MCP4826544.1 hypothetical protein [Shimia sp.]
MERLSQLSLHHPVWIAVACLVVGLGGGAFFDTLFSSGFFGRAGAITVALGVITFGATAGDLLIRSQVGRIADKNGDLPHPYNRKNLTRVMGMQTVVVVVGTIQWGFGDLIGAKLC